MEVMGNLSNAAFATLLTDAMAAHGWADADVAPRCGVNAATVNRWRHGLVVPADDKLDVLVALLEVDEEVVAKSMRTGRGLIRGGIEPLAREIGHLKTEVAKYVAENAALKRRLPPDKSGGAPQGPDGPRRGRP